MPARVVRTQPASSIAVPGPAAGRGTSRTVRRRRGCPGDAIGPAAGTDCCHETRARSPVRCDHGRARTERRRRVCRGHAKEVEAGRRVEPVPVTALTCENETLSAKSTRRTPSWSVVVVRAFHLGEAISSPAKGRSPSRSRAYPRLTRSARGSGRSRRHAERALPTWVPTSFQLGLTPRALTCAGMSRPSGSWVIDRAVSSRNASKSTTADDCVRRPSPRVSCSRNRAPICSRLSPRVLCPTKPWCWPNRRARSPARPT